MSNHKKARNVMLVVLVANCVICVAKLIVGSLIHSASLTADGFHSLSDGAANVVGLIGIGFASRPVDEDHPYGHSKFETLAGLIIAGILAVVGVEIVAGAIGKLSNPIEPHVTLPVLALMAGTLAVNIATTLTERRQGKKLMSAVLSADAKHTASDIWVTLGVFVTLAGLALGLPAIVDPIASFVVAGFIFYAAWTIMRETSGVLLDRAAEDHERIEAIALRFPEVKRVHKVRSRAAGSEEFIELHVQMDPDLRVEASHRCVHEIIAAIRADLGRPVQVIIHTEPFYDPPIPADKWGK